MTGYIYRQLWLVYAFGDVYSKTIEGVKIKKGILRII
jgi:hypothetical protein